MDTIDPQAAENILRFQLQPWHDAVSDPKKAQEEILDKLIKIYAKTRYGVDHGTSNIETVEDFRKSFPIKNYEEYKPIIQKVMEGDIDLLQFPLWTSQTHLNAISIDRTHHNYR